MLQNFVNSVKQKCNWSLLNTRRISYYLDEKTKIMLVQKLVLFKLDYCNALYMNLTKSRFKKLESLLNSGIRFIYNIYDRSTDLKPFYVKAHFLPMELRVQFKICLLAYRVMYDQAPLYLKDLLSKEDINTNTRSRPDYDSLRFKLPKLQPSLIDARRFSVHAPELWNSLPFDIRSLCNIKAFKKKLKTSLFAKFKGSLTQRA